MSETPKTGRGRFGKRAADPRHSVATKVLAIAAFSRGERPWRVAKELGLNFNTVYGWFSKFRNELAKGAA